MISEALDAFERKAAMADTLEWAITTCGQNISEFQRQDAREFGHFEHFIEICMQLITRDSNEIEGLLFNAVKAAQSEEPFAKWKRRFIDNAESQKR